MKLLQKKINTVVLSVAGLDPSGGAGVYSDVKTFEHFGLKGLAVPTVLTIQNDDTFKTMENVSDKVFLEMLDLMFGSYKIAGLKIGLIKEKYQVDAIVERIKKSKPTITVLDPIISSSSGTKFWDKELLSYIVKQLLPCIDVVTPNYLEAVAILDAAGESTTGINKQELAKKLNRIFRTKVAVTGGDLVGENKVTDVFYSGTELKVRETEYFDVPKGLKHGTGCKFSSALLANMCNGVDFIDACMNAAKFVENKILEARQ